MVVQRFKMHIVIIYKILAVPTGVDRAKDLYFYKYISKNMYIPYFLKL